MKRIGKTIMGVLRSGTPTPRPILSQDLESDIKGLFVIGDLAGAPVIKLAMEHGVRVIETISKKKGLGQGGDVLDILIVGLGAAGINAALEAQERGLSYLALERGKIANTVENFPAGKWVYAEPDKIPPKGKLWLDGATKEDLLGRWNRIIEENHLKVRTGEGVEAIKKEGDLFTVISDKARYQARYVVLATGQRGNPRKLGAPGEEREHVYHKLYSPKLYRDKDILVVGGGNAAVEAALVLSEQNRVTISYRRERFGRVFQDNRRRLDAARSVKKIEVILRSQVVEFGEKDVLLKLGGDQGEEKRLPCDKAFVLIGARPPVAFLNKIGIGLEGTWKPKRFAYLALAFLLCWTIYAVKAPSWPYNVKFLPAPNADVVEAGSASSWMDLAAGTIFVEAANFEAVVKTGGEFDYSHPRSLKQEAGSRLKSDIKIPQGTAIPRLVTKTPINIKEFLTFEFAGRKFSPSFWYSLLYCLLMTVFGLQAMKRWGFDLKDKYQIARFASLLFFQWVFFFILPEFVMRDWRAYGLVYAWPLFFNTFFDGPGVYYMAWGLVLTGLVIPVLVLFHGKRYCTWVCGCGGLAETLGDRWRHLAPKGKRSQKMEVMGDLVLFLAFAITIAYFVSNTISAFAPGVAMARRIYSVGVDIWLVGIIPVTLYPFLGGKIWCRYWCPLAKLMEHLSRFFVRIGVSRFAIHANDKCITCGECTRYCQVGIDVMSFALKQEVLDNSNSSCIGCGVCVTVCPMDTLGFKGKI